MKLSELRKLIVETVKEEVLQEYKPIDEIGTFYIVEKAKKGMTKDDIVKEVTVFDEIMPENVVGVYLKRPTARQKASEVIKEMETNLKELETSMNDFREAKNSIEEKKKKAADIIKKLK